MYNVAALYIYIHTSKIKIEQSGLLNRTKYFNCKAQHATIIRMNLKFI